MDGAWFPRQKIRCLFNLKLPTIQVRDHFDFTILVTVAESKPQILMAEDFSPIKMSTIEDYWRLWGCIWIQHFNLQAFTSTEKQNALAKRLQYCHKMSGQGKSTILVSIVHGPSNMLWASYSYTSTAISPTFYNPSVRTRTRNKWLKNRWHFLQR